MSKKSRGRRHSVRDLEPASTSDWGEPPVFTDLEIEDERPPYGRRMLSHSWPEEEDESWADEGVRPASEPPAVDAAVLTVARPVDATVSPDTSPEEPPVDEPGG